MDIPSQLYLVRDIMQDIHPQALGMNLRSDAVRKGALHCANGMTRPRYSQQCLGHNKVRYQERGCAATYSGQPNTNEPTVTVGTRKRRLGLQACAKRILWTPLWAWYHLTFRS